jgi:LemA protein
LSSRGQALAAILAAAAEPLADERPALDAVASALAQVLAAQELLRKRPVAQAMVADLAKADAVLTAVNQRLLALVGQHALLRQQPEVQAALAVLQAQGPQLQFARQAFNEAGLRYNQALADFPTRLLVPVFRFDAAGKF